MKVRIYIEGGGEGKELDEVFRRAWKRFFEAAGVRRKPPSSEKADGNTHLTHSGTARSGALRKKHRSFVVRRPRARSLFARHAASLATVSIPEGDADIDTPAAAAALDPHR